MDLIFHSPKPCPWTSSCIHPNLNGHSNPRLQRQHFIQDGNTGTVGITGFAAKALGDVVFVDLPGVGDVFEAGYGQYEKI